jgi:hypothetical protein
LPEIGDGAGAQGFNPPLTGSTYTFWLQQTEENSTYQLDFVVTESTPQALLGDYNGNQAVDAADYVLWRNGGPLENEVETPGSVTSGDYTEWRTRFGNAAAVATSVSVPESATSALALVGMAVQVTLGQRTTARRVRTRSQHK